MSTLQVLVVVMVGVVVVVRLTNHIRKYIRKKKTKNLQSRGWKQDCPSIVIEGGCRTMT